MTYPDVNLEPTAIQEVRDVVKNLAFYAAWGLVRAGLALSRLFEPCEVCPLCGPYPVLGHDGRCAVCGAVTFDSGETGEFRP